MEETKYLATLHALWQKAWPPGVKEDPVYPQGEVPLTEYLRAWARRQPEKPAVIFYGNVLTYAELDRLSDRFAALLSEKGIGRGDRVAVFMPNCPQFHIAFFGILKLGAIYTPVSPMAKAFELTHYLQDSGSCALVTLDQLMPLVREVRAHSALREVIATSLIDFTPAKPDIPVTDQLVTARIPCTDATDMMPALLACAVRVPAVTIGLDDVAALNYTGGTTGLPKGCIHTGRDMICMAAALAATMADLNRDAVILAFFPEFWIAGENLALIVPVFNGATLVLLNRWDPVAFMAAVESYQVTMTTMLIDNLAEVLDHSRAAEFNLRTLKQVGGVSFVKKLNPEYRRRWLALTGCMVAESAWGMTETHTSNTFTTGMQDNDFDLKSQPIFVGLPAPGNEFKICDFDTGALLPLGSEGELCVRSPSLLKGYWNKPEASSQALRNGWLHSGDIGLIDEQGYLHFLGRRKEMLKVNGMSVFPAEIEAMLGQHPAILGSAVVGVADADRGQRPIAFVVLKPELRKSADAASLTAWCRQAMSVYKVPEIRLVESLPMTATGKVKKDELIGILEAGA